jgi:hypothetical protein
MWHESLASPLPDSGSVLRISHAAANPAGPRKAPGKEKIGCTCWPTRPAGNLVWEGSMQINPRSKAELLNVIENALEKQSTTLPDDSLEVSASSAS